MPPIRSTILIAVALLVARPVDGRGQGPAGCADVVRQSLGTFQGEWEVQALFRTGPGTWDSTRALSSITADLGGCLLQERYRGTRYGKPYEYLALWGANGDGDAPLQRFFVHSQHGVFGLAAGGFRGDTLVLEERVIVQGQQVIQQTRTSRPTATGFTLLGRRSTDGGVTWIVTLDAVFRRRNA